MYFHSRLKTFSGNEQQSSEIISNGLEIDLPPRLCSHIRELRTVICVFTGMVVLWVDFTVLPFDLINMRGLS